MTDKSSSPSATSSETPRADSFRDDILSASTDEEYQAAVDALIAGAQQLEHDLEICRDAHMANCLAADTLRTEIRDLRDDMERGMANHNADLSVPSEIAPSLLREHVLGPRETIPSAIRRTEWCKAGEFGCECGRPDTEPCPLPHRATQRTVAPHVDGRDFYELCQQYRHAKEMAPHPDLPNTVQAFDNLREYVKTGKLPWPSYEEKNDG